MTRLLNFFFLLTAFCLFGEELEVRLATKVPLKPVYLTQLSDTAVDWRYLHELRAVLHYDLSHNGYSTLVPTRDDWEQKINRPDPRTRFDLSHFRREQIPFVIAIDATQESFTATAFHIEQGTSKRYPDIALTGKPEIDRPHIHQLADAIQKDLFGQSGIAASRIVYSQRTKNSGAGPEWLSSLWICDSDGANAKPLPAAKGYCMSPGFLPGQTGYYYVSSEKGQAKIYRARFDNGPAEVWVTLRGNQLLPALSPTGSQIAFITDVAGRPDLFVQNLDRHGNEIGRPRQLFSAPRSTTASPTFSPDGRKIAFVSDKDGTPRIYTLDVKDPKDTRRVHPKLLSRKNRENTGPSWSPDGTKMAYSARTDGVRQIWIYDFSTEQEWQLTLGADNKENPSWAADSLHLIYNTETNDLSELFIIDLHSQEPIQITNGFEQKRFPSWEK